VSSEVRLKPLPIDHTRPLGLAASTAKEGGSSIP
jgi:hypothetical protein